jgi:hypothetical protein
MPHQGKHSPNLPAFAKRLARLQKQVVKLGGEYKKAVANRVHERFVLGTPVDTSAALSNWQIATGATGPIMSAIPAHVPGEHGSTYLLSVAATLNAAIVPIRFAPDGQPIVVSNIIDYILGLTYYPFNSPQASAGWLSDAINLGLRQGVVEVNTKVVW